MTELSEAIHRWVEEEGAADWLDDEQVGERYKGEGVIIEPFPLALNSKLRRQWVTVVFSGIILRGMARWMILWCCWWTS